MQYNQDCSTYSIHMLYSMMRLREKKYKLKDLGYVPLYLSMEYMRNHDFIASFNDILYNFIYNNFRHDNYKHIKLYNEEIYINHGTVSGIDIRLVEPIDLFKIHVRNIGFYNMFGFVEFLMHLEFCCCLDCLFEKFKKHTARGSYVRYHYNNKKRYEISSENSKAGIIDEIRIYVFKSGNKMFIESFNKYFPTPQ